MLENCGRQRRVCGRLLLDYWIAGAETTAFLSLAKDNFTRPLKSSTVPTHMSA
jgi:hypothetical protein